MVNKIRSSKLLYSIVCIVLITAMALTFTGCQNAKSPESPDETSTLQEQTVSFKLVVVDADGNKNTFDIDTTETTVGAALLKEGLIEGEEGQYGLYVKTVNGITADYDKDGTYWAFYISDEYAKSGVDMTDIVEGETYTLKVEKG